jgi:hypothetical protein
VLRSPHVNKTSREHFWMRIHRRAFDWDAPVGAVPDMAERQIAETLPTNVAVRVTVNAPAIYRLHELWDTLERARAQREEKARALENVSGTTSSNDIGIGAALS